MTLPGRPDPAHGDEVDPGLFRQRTTMAWTRTALSFAALGGALLKTTTPWVGGLVLGMGALVWGLGRMADRTGRPQSLRRHRHFLITATVMVVSLSALAVALLGSGSDLRLR